MTKDCIVIKSKIRNIVDETGTKEIQNVSEDVAEALDLRVREMIKEGVKRAERNHRKTLYGRDI
jgi:histone H3/H4